MFWGFGERRLMMRGGGGGSNARETCELSHYNLTVAVPISRS